MTQDFEGEMFDIPSDDENNKDDESDGELACAVQQQHSAVVIES